MKGQLTGNWFGAAIAVTALALVSGRAAAVRTDWPCFRGGPWMRGVARCTLAKSPRLLWTHETNSSIESTAAVVGDTVYIATYSGQLMALRLRDGKKRWGFKAGGSISASPDIAWGRVYIGDEMGTFYAVNSSTGKLDWKYETDGKIMSSANAMSDSVLFGSYDNNLYRLNAKTGKKIWAFRAEAQVHCTPCIADGLAIIAGCDGILRMIDVESGKERRSTYLGGNFATTPAYNRNRVYVGNMSGEYHSVRFSDGKVVWKALVQKNGGASYGSAAAYGDSVIFPSRNGTVFSLNRDTGGTNWVVTTGDEVDSSPVIVGNRVFFGSNDGSLYGVSLASGKKLWEFDAGARISASPAIGEQRLVIGSQDGAIYCFGR